MKNYRAAGSGEPAAFLFFLPDGFVREQAEGTGVTTVSPASSIPEIPLSRVNSTSETLEIRFTCVNTT